MLGWDDIGTPETGNASPTAPEVASPDVTTSTIDNLANRIANVESGGKYDAVGPVTKSGDRAFGKYQIMGANVPAWTEEATGKWHDADEFLKDPDLQERTAKFKIKQIYDKHGNARDVASVWHSGAPYEQAVREGRKDATGRTTKDYADAVASGFDQPAPTAAPAEPTPIPETAKPVSWETVGTPEAPESAPSDVAPRQTVATGALPPKEMSVEDYGKQLNIQSGLPETHPFGRYTAALGKPASDALRTLYDIASSEYKDPEHTDLIKDAFRVFSLIGVPAEAGAEVVMQAARDRGWDPNVQALLGTLTAVGLGAKTRIPGIEGVPETEMPLQGTKLTRQAAQEATAASTEAETRAAAARGEEETARASEQEAATRARQETAAATRQAQQETTEAARRGAEWTEATQQVGAEDVKATAARTEAAAQEADAQATAARQTADEAAAKVAPSTGARERAQAALAPAEVTAPQGGQAAEARMEERLAEARDPTSRVYNQFVADHGAEQIDLNTEHGILSQAAALAKAGRLTGDAGKEVQALTDKVMSGERLTVNDLNTYKRNLDIILPGGPTRLSTPAERDLYEFKLHIRDWMREHASGEEKEWLKAADDWYRDVVIAKGKPRAIGAILRKIKQDPATAVTRLLGKGTTQQQGEMAEAIMRELGDHPAAEAFRQAHLANVMEEAIDPITGELDPKTVAATVKNYNTKFADVMLTPEQKTFFKVLRQEQAAAKAAEATVTTAERAATRTRAASERELTSARTEAESRYQEALGAEKKGTAEAQKREKAAIAEAQAREEAAPAEAVARTKEAAKQAKVAETEAGQAKTAAEVATAEARQPNKAAKLAAMTGKGLLFTLTEGVATALGIPVYGGIGVGAELFIPTKRIAEVLANSKNANMLARALKASPRSAIAPTLIKELQKNGVLFEQEKPAEETKNAANIDYATDPRFNTQLSPDDEKRFQAWKSQYAPKDSGADYDLRGAFKAGLKPNAQTGHWPDTFKKPNHPTFSDQSKYAPLAPERAGSWQGETYIPAKAKAAA